MKLRWVVLGLLLVGLLVPAAMITVVRVLQPEDGRWVRLVAFTPYAAFLYAGALLLLLLAMAGGRGPRRASGLVAWLVLPLLALHLFWASAPYVGNVPEARGQQYTVMTANLAVGAADPARVVDLAARNDVDALVLTEITPTALQKLNQAGLSRVLPHAEGEAASGVDGTMVFSARAATDVVRLDTTSGGYALTVPVGGQGTVQLIAVHPHPAVGDAAEWRADHEQIRDFVAQNEAAADATVLAGDFNATLDHRVMQDLQDLGFRSAADTANAQWQPTWPSSGEMSVLGVAIPSTLTIDHLLAAGRLEAFDIESATIAGTDHRALVATLTTG